MSNLLKIKNKIHFNIEMHMCIGRSYREYITYFVTIKYPIVPRSLCGRLNRLTHPICDTPSQENERI